MVKDYPIGSVIEYENTPLKVVCSKEGLPKCTDCFFVMEKDLKEGCVNFHAMFTNWHAHLLKEETKNMLYLNHD